MPPYSLQSLAALPFLLLLAACGASPESAQRGGTASTPAAGGSEGITLSEPAARREGRLRVLVYHDMEGLAGQDNYRTFNYSHPEYYAHGQAMLAADINAVVDGLFAGGATSVEVVDAHGSGNPAPDVVPSLLDARATQLTRDSAFRQYVDIVAPDTYDAVVAVGMHAKTGSGGFASHTYTLGMDILMHGRSLTETELVALSWGRVGVPVILVTGDDRLGADLATMPWIRFVTTKHATSASTVRLRNVDSVHAEMRAQAAEAVRQIGEARVLTVDTPVPAALRVVHPASLTMLRGVPGITLSGEDDMVEFIAPDFQAAYDGVVSLIGVARLTYPQVQGEVIRAHPDSGAILRSQRERLMERWLDVESGRWRAPEPLRAGTGRRHHGAS